MRCKDMPRGTGRVEAQGFRTKKDTCRHSATSSGDDDAGNGGRVAQENVGTCSVVICVVLRSA